MVQRWDVRKWRGGDAGFAGGSGAGLGASVTGGFSTQVSLQAARRGLRVDLGAVIRADSLRWAIMDSLCGVESAALAVSQGGGRCAVDRPATRNRQTLRSPRTARYEAGTLPCSEDRARKKRRHRLMGAWCALWFRAVKPGCRIYGSGRILLLLKRRRQLLLKPIMKMSTTGQERPLSLLVSNVANRANG